MKVRMFVLMVLALVAGGLGMAQEFTPPATTGLTTSIDGLLVIGGAVALAFAGLSLFKRGVRRV
jgi:hypothetical protein